MKITLARRLATIMILLLLSWVMAYTIGQWAAHVDWPLVDVRWVIPVAVSYAAAVWLLVRLGLEKAAMPGPQVLWMLATYGGILFGRWLAS